MTAPARNLVICSDGTGNSGRGADGTNVWRLRQAVQAFSGDENEDNTVQDVIYHDGVGTEAFLPKRILGLAFSYGVTSDLEYLYERLMLQYRPGDENTEGDKLYLFGFSRGAFTIRTFAYILYRCGLASPFQDDGETRRSLSEIREIARTAVLAYKMRHLGDDEAFRLRYGIPDRHAPEDKDLKGRVPIRFLGVWDTVSAVGLPFHNLTQFFLRFWRAVTTCPPLKLLRLSLLNLYRPTTKFWTEWENDLHPRIENAFQALAIDDERETFYPMLWLEHEEVPEESDQEKERSEECHEIVARRVHTFLPVNREKKVRVRRLSATNVEQVWFAGMHANVGGGYEKDHLAHVSLEWMMDHADNCGLKFDRSLRAHYRQMADPLGKMHDSRSGAGMLYRFNPRDVEWFTRDAGVGTVISSDTPPASGVPLPLIHETVLERIRDSSQAYAPTLLPPPGGYRIAGKPQIESGSQRTRSKIADVSEKDSLALCAASSGDTAASANVRKSALETIQLYIVLRRAAARWVIYIILLAFLLTSTGLLDSSAEVDVSIFSVLGKVNLAIYEGQTWLSPKLQSVPPLVLVTLSLGLLFVSGLLAAAWWNWGGRSNRAGDPQPRNPGKASSLLRELLTGVSVFLAGFLFRPLARMTVEAFAPKTLADWLQGILQSGFVFGLLCLIVYIVLWFNNHYRQRILHWSRFAWDSVMFGKSQQPDAFRFWPRKLVDWVFGEQHGGPGRYIGRIATRWWYPLMSSTVFAGAILFALWIPVADLLTRASVQEAAESDNKTDSGLMWDASHTFSTGKNVVRGQHYVVSVEIEEELQDSIVPGHLDGIELDSKSPLPEDSATSHEIATAKKFMRLAGPFKRLPSAKYFKLCGSIGSPAAPGFEISPDRTFTAAASGQLYLFLNDVPGFNINNRGKLKVSVRQISSQ